MNANMPELKDWQCWQVSMEGDIVTVAIHATKPGPCGKKFIGERIRFGTVDTSTYVGENTLVTAVIDKARTVLVCQKDRDKRYGWIMDNFS